MLRPDLVFVIDVRDWAFDNIANRIEPSLRDRWTVKRYYVSDHPDISTLVAAIAQHSAPCHVHVFWRPLVSDLLDPTVLKRCEKIMGWPYGDALRRIARHSMTTSIYDHLGLAGIDAANGAAMLTALDGYSVASPILEGIYLKNPAMPKPLAVLADGVDRKYYRPANLERLKEVGRPMRVGWVGNSQWGLLEGIPDAKGLNTIIRPAIQLLHQMGIEVELDVIDRADKWVPRSEVAEYYNTLDVLLCASLVEGTPNPVLEAMASGVPIVSTDVGIVRMCVGDRQAAFIVDRTPVAFSEALALLFSKDGLRAELSKENLQRIAKHDWQARLADWRQFFEKSYSCGLERGPQARHAELVWAQGKVRKTSKMRIRSFLRRSPFAYAASARILHAVSGALGRLRLTIRR